MDQQVVIELKLSKFQALAVVYPVLRLAVDAVDGDHGQVGLALVAGLDLLIVPVARGCIPDFVGQPQLFQQAGDRRVFMIQLFIRGLLYRQLSLAIGQLLVFVLQIVAASADLVFDLFNQPVQFFLSGQLLLGLWIILNFSQLLLQRLNPGLHFGQAVLLVLNLCFLVGQFALGLLQALFKPGHPLVLSGQCFFLSGQFALLAFEVFPLRGIVVKSIELTRQVRAKG